MSIQATSKELQTLSSSSSPRIGQKLLLQMHQCQELIENHFLQITEKENAHTKLCLKKTCAISLGLTLIGGLISLLTHDASYFEGSLLLALVPLTVYMTYIKKMELPQTAQLHGKLEEIRFMMAVTEYSLQQEIQKKEGINTKGEEEELRDIKNEWRSLCQLMPSYKFGDVPYPMSPSTQPRFEPIQDISEIRQVTVKVAENCVQTETVEVTETIESSKRPRFDRQKRLDRQAAKRAENAEKHIRRGEMLPTQDILHATVASSPRKPKKIKGNAAISIAHSVGDRVKMGKERAIADKRKQEKIRKRHEQVLTNAASEARNNRI